MPRHGSHAPYHYTRKEQLFTLKDLARIAKHLQEHRGIDAKDILVTIAISVGLGFVFCKAAIAIRSGLSIMAFIEKIGIMMAFGQAITVLLEFLLAVKLVAPAWLKIFMALFISGLFFVEKMLRQFNEFAQDKGAIQDAAKLIGELCDTAKRLSGQAVDKTCEQLNADAAYQCEVKAQELADAVKPDIQQAIDILNTSWWDKLQKIILDKLHDGDWENIP